MCYGTGMKRRYWMAWALGLLAAAVPTGRGADAVVEFYRTQPGAEQYVLHETSLYELRQAIGGGCARRLDFWRRVAEKFSKNPEVIHRCEDRKRWWEAYRDGTKKGLEENIGQRMTEGDRLFYYESHDAKGGECGKLILASDGHVKWKQMETGEELVTPGWPEDEEAQWRQKTEPVLRTIKGEPGKLEANAAAAFLRNRSDAGIHSLHPTSCHGLGIYLLDVAYPGDWRPRSKDPLAYGPWHDVPGALEVDEAEESALQAWLAPRKAIVERIETEAEPTDRLYWDVSDDGTHRRAGLLWLRWNGSVRQEWPDFGDAGKTSDRTP